MSNESDTAASRLAAIVRSSDDAIVSKDLNGTITTWNPAAERLFGYTAAEAIGKSIRIVIPHDRQAEEDGVLSRIRRGEAVAHFETIRQRRDGTQFPISLTVSPVLDDKGVVIGASKIARDITERRMAEAALAAAERSRADLQHRLLTLVSASHSLFVSPRIDDVRPAILSLARQLVAADGYAVWRVDETTDRWRIDSSHGISDGFLAGGVPASHPDGRRVMLDGPMVVDDVLSAPHLADRRDLYAREGIRSMLGVPLNPTAAETGTLMFYYRSPHVFEAVEIHAAVALANLASAALASIALHDSQRRSRLDADFLAESGKVLSTSLDYEETLQRVAQLAVPYFADWCTVDLAEGDTIRRLAIAHVDPERVRMAQRFAQRYPEDPNSAFSVRAVIRTGSPVMMSEVPDHLLAARAKDPEHLRALRELRLSSFMIVPLRAHGTTFGALTLVAGESGRRYTAVDLRLAEEVAYRAALSVDNARAYAEARRANRVKDDFLATLSHELRTPLNALVGYARMLRLGILAADGQQRAFDVIDRNATALTRIVNDVLDMSRIVSGKLRLNVRRVNLADAIAQSIEAVQLAADAKGIQIEVHLPAAPILARVDPDRIQQLVWNLVSNAVKFTPRGGHVDVTLGRADDGLDIRVQDTGIGIAPEFLPHVFERFEQADSRYAREHGGLGLGLAIARHLAEMHGGTLAAESDGPNLGATFTVRLPGAETMHDPELETGAIEAPALPRLDGLSILLVDDERDAVMMVREVLESAGATVATANSGEEALAAMDRSEPDLLVTDIGMPGMDGFDLIARIRARPAGKGGRVPAAALTAYARSDERTRVLQSGFDLHLAKPIDPVSLIVALAALSKRLVNPA